MPSLDRRIVVRHSVHTFDQFGTAQITVTDYPQWTTREDFSQADKEMAGGTLTTATRGYIVRYRSEIADALTTELSVVDGALTLDCTNITEATVRGERRKFLRIECTGEVV